MTGVQTCALPISSLNTINNAWRTFVETRWAELRFETLQLYKIIKQNHPKLFSLAFLIDELQRDHPEVEVIVRVSSEAAGNALASDMLEFGIKLSETIDRFWWAPLADRLPWTERPRIEVYLCAPSPWQRSTLWSAESTFRLFLVYPFELNILQGTLRDQVNQLRSESVKASVHLGIGEPPVFDWPTNIPVAYEFNVEHRVQDKTQPVVDLSFDINVLFDQLDEEAVEATRTPASVETGPVLAVPVVLEPGNEVWWARASNRVEVLRRHIHQEVSPDQLLPGDEIIMPRGEGREGLFRRAIEAVHGRGDLVIHETALARVQKACLKIYQESGEVWEEATRKMRLEGSTVTCQTIRLWGRGDIIAPSDDEDIRRLGCLAGDDLLRQRYHRIGAVAKQVRRLHQDIGRLLSAAMREAVIGTGPNLSRLAQVLGKADVDELLDEFELRIVRRTEPSIAIPAQRIGTIEKR